MHVGTLGEFGLIERIKKSIELDASVVVGPGDDCAVIKFDRENYLLLTCDMLVEGVDFTARADPYLIGRKALAVSLSDIAACGGTARYAVVSLGLRKRTPVAFVDKLSRGLNDLAKKYKVNVVGGDISRASDLTLNVTVVGTVRKKHLVLRSGARQGDIIFVTGELGGSIRGRHFTFVPRLREAHFLVSNFKIHAMIDISDGLVQDLGHIAEQSGVGAVLFEDRIPVSKEARNLGEALSMGEDFELLFTVSRNVAKKIIDRGRPYFSPIGEIKEARYGLRLSDRHNREKPIKGKGFQHF